MTSLKGIILIVASGSILASCKVIQGVGSSPLSEVTIRLNQDANNFVTVSSQGWNTAQTNPGFEKLGCACVEEEAGWVPTAFASVGGKGLCIKLANASELMSCIDAQSAHPAFCIHLQP